MVMINHMAPIAKACLDVSIWKTPVRNQIYNPKKNESNIRKSFPRVSETFGFEFGGERLVNDKT